MMNHATAPSLVKLSPASTVNFNAYPTVMGNTYGNVILSGSVVKTFAADTVTVDRKQKAKKQKKGRGRRGPARTSAAGS